MSTSTVIQLAEKAIPGTGPPQSGREPAYCNDTWTTLSKNAWSFVCGDGYWASYQSCNKKLAPKREVPYCEGPVQAGRETTGQTRKLKRYLLSDKAPQVFPIDVSTPTVFQYGDRRSLPAAENVYVRSYKLGEILCDYRADIVVSDRDRVQLQDIVVSNVSLLYSVYVGKEVELEGNITEINRSNRNNVFWTTIFPEYCFREVLPTSRQVAAAIKGTVLSNEDMLKRTYTYFDYESISATPSRLCRDWAQSTNTLAVAEYKRARAARCAANSQLLEWVGCDGYCLDSPTGNVCVEYYKARCRELMASPSATLSPDQKLLCACYQTDAFNATFYADLKERLGPKLAALIQNDPQCIQPTCAASRYKRTGTQCQNINACFSEINFTNQGNIVAAGDIKLTSNVQCDQYKTDISDTGAAPTTPPTIPPPGTESPKPLGNTEIYSIVGGVLGFVLVCVLVYVFARRGSNPNEAQMSDDSFGSYLGRKPREYDDEA